MSGSATVRESRRFRSTEVPGTVQHVTGLTSNDPPAAFLITMRCYGTWLHGDDRGSTDRDNNTYRSLTRPIEPALKEWERMQLKHAPAVLDLHRREVVDRVITEVAQYRGWYLHALHIRTNHMHVVVSAGCKPELVMNTFKAYVTRALRNAGVCGPVEHIWSRHGSTHHLWEEWDVERACQYVIEEQGERLPGPPPRRWRFGEDEASE